MHAWHQLGFAHAPQHDACKAPPAASGWCNQGHHQVRLSCRVGLWAEMHMSAMRLSWADEGRHQQQTRMPSVCQPDRCAAGRGHVRSQAHPSELWSRHALAPPESMPIVTRTEQVCIAGASDRNVHQMVTPILLQGTPDLSLTVMTVTRRTAESTVGRCSTSSGGGSTAPPEDTSATLPASGGATLNFSCHYVASLRLLASAKMGRCTPMKYSPHSGRSRIVRGLAGPLWFVAIVSVSVGTYESLRVGCLSSCGALHASVCSEALWT